MAVVDQIKQIGTLSVKRIGSKIAQATPEELAQTVEGLNEKFFLIYILRGLTYIPLT